MSETSPQNQMIEVPKEWQQEMASQAEFNRVANEAMANAQAEEARQKIEAGAKVAGIALNQTTKVEYPTSSNPRQTETVPVNNQNWRHGIGSPGNPYSVR